MSRKESSEELEKYLELLQKMLSDIQYGSIIITVQDGKIVQIEKTQKYRVRN